MDNNSNESKGFFKHVFNFEDDSKVEILNILQYSFIGTIPVIILNKIMQKYVPDVDDKKSSLEISAEIMIQIIVMFMGLLLIHRMITYIPTYSNSKYPEFHVVYVILAILMITMSLQTKIGEKVSVLGDRILELWNGKPLDKKKGGKVKVSQPISGQSVQQPQQPQQATSQSYTDGTAISALPNYDSSSKSLKDSTPLVDASQSEGMTPFEPQAANGVFSGGSFSSW